MDEEEFKRFQKHKVAQQVSERVERVSELHNGNIHIHIHIHTNITLDQAHKTERDSGAAEN